MTELPLFRATQQESRAQLKHKQEPDAAKVTQRLATTSSIASKYSQIYTPWGLSRSFIRDILQSVANNRRLKPTLNNLVGATRFKTLEGRSSDVRATTPMRAA